MIVVSTAIFFGEPAFSLDSDHSNLFHQKSVAEKIVISLENPSLEGLLNQDIPKNQKTIEIYGEQIPVSRNEKRIISRLERSPMTLEKLNKRRDFLNKLYLKHQQTKIVPTYTIHQTESVARFIQQYVEIEEKKADVQSPARQKSSGRKLKESEMEARERQLYEELKRQAGDTIPTLGDLND